MDIFSLCSRRRWGQKSSKFDSERPFSSITAKVILSPDGFSSWRCHWSFSSEHLKEENYSNPDRQFIHAGIARTLAYPTEHKIRTEAGHATSDPLRCSGSRRHRATLLAWHAWLSRTKILRSQLAMQEKPNKQCDNPISSAHHTTRDDSVQRLRFFCSTPLSISTLRILCAIQVASPLQIF